MTPLVAHASFPAMSTTVTITGVGVPARAVTRAAERGRFLAEEWENRFSRFRPQSLLCRLNGAGGEATVVDDEFLDMLEIAMVAVAGTGGHFDPSILPALEAAGYDRSIERVQAAPFLAMSAPLPAAGQAAWNRVQIDHDCSQVQLPPEMRLDFGGIAKGRFVDRLAATLSDWPGGCVDAGGDLYLWGVSPGGERWAIGIEDPARPDSDLLVAEVTAQHGLGIATSGTHRRQWHAGDRLAHHLIDPRSGAPLAAGARSVTAVAWDVATAEVATKALLVASTENAADTLFGATVGVLDYADGRIIILTEESHDDSSISFGWPVSRSA